MELCGWGNFDQLRRIKCRLHRKGVNVSIAWAEQRLARTSMVRYKKPLVQKPGCLQRQLILKLLSCLEKLTLFNTVQAVVAKLNQSGTRRMLPWLRAIADTDTSSSMRRRCQCAVTMTPGQDQGVERVGEGGRDRRTVKLSPIRLGKLL
eukprot:2095232-Rhodomonas_salina.1